MSHRPCGFELAMLQSILNLLGGPNPFPTKSSMCIKQLFVIYFHSIKDIRGCLKFLTDRHLSCLFLITPVAGFTVGVVNASPASYGGRHRRATCSRAARCCAAGCCAALRGGPMVKLSKMIKMISRHMSNYETKSDRSDR